MVCSQTDVDRYGVHHVIDADEYYVFMNMCNNKHVPPILTHYFNNLACNHMCAERVENCQKPCKIGGDVKN